MRIAIVTDAWAPQVNGVVRTLQAITAELRAVGHAVEIIAPDSYRSFPCPSYPEIRLAMTTGAMVGRRIAAFEADAVHLATEGPLCLAARRWCIAMGLPFTTAYHTQFPDYVAKRTPIPAKWVWRYIRWFHDASQAVLVSTASVRQTLAEHGIKRLQHWSRGVDLATFNPTASPPSRWASLPRPIQLYVGRVAVEKNIAAFLESGHPGSRIVVGDGPARAELAARFPDALFVGPLFGADLASAFAGADIFVFPSRTDTFGLVMIEALACGTPVAAYPVSGPIDVLTPEVGAMDEDLGQAIGRALTLDRDACARYARSFTWEGSARQFLNALVPIGSEGLADHAALSRPTAPRASEGDLP